MNKLENLKVCVIGLGYVGFPLAVELGKMHKTVGYDINTKRVEELKEGKDKTLEIDSKDIKNAKFLKLTSNLEDISECNFYIVTVPTPIDKRNLPDLEPLKSASLTVGKVLSKDDIVVYESTVFPGATEEICVPILEQESKLSFNEDFFCGYSPERINPGDRVHRLTAITKVVSASNESSLEIIDELYGSIITAGTYKASSIKVAEAAKVIENTQRDVNIALINELSQIFSLLNIDTQEVLDAAETKWNFLPFKPGLVGGHCIGVDPYYLTKKALDVGYRPEIILAGRQLNDSMGSYVVNEVVKLMSQKEITTNDSNILVMGVTFKENCPDFRNTKVVDIVDDLVKRGANIDIFDPWVDKEDFYDQHNFHLIEEPKNGIYDAVILTVSHDIFRSIGINSIRSFGKENHVLYDCKNLFHRNETDGRL